ncbi:Cof-type HAD-IIB family hydrolase [Lactobacillaceae bacterium Scapto_B20]
MSQKLIALDLDGTTLDNHSEVAPVTNNIIKEVVERGHIVSIVTGWSTRLAMPAYESLMLNSPMINFNGSLGLIPNQSWAGEYEFAIDKRIVLDLLNHREELGINVMAAEDKNSLLANRNASDALYETSCGFFPNQLLTSQILSPTTLLNDPIGIAVDYDANKLESLTKYIDQHYGNQIEIAHWGGPLSVLEIKRKGVDKAYGVKALANHFNIAKENIVAIGDQVNDLPLLSAAGTKVAMKNAVDQVKSIADVVTEYDNDQNGVARYLKQQII